MNVKMSSSEILNFLAEVLQDSPQETPYSSSLAALQELYNTLAESFLLPSAFPGKHHVQQRVRTIFGQLDFLSFFPNIMDGPLHCLVGLSARERTFALSKHAQVIPIPTSYNESIPTFFTDRLSSAFFVSGHGRKQFASELSLQPLLDSIFSSRIELRRLFSALGVGLPGKLTRGAIADFPKYALPDSRFFAPAIHLADTVVISLRNRENRQLITECFNYLAEKTRPAYVFAVGDTQYIPRNFLHLVTKHCDSIEDVQFQEDEMPYLPASILYSLMAPLLQFPAWLASQGNELQSRIHDLTNDIVMSREDGTSFGESLKALRKELSEQKKQFADLKENADCCIKAIWDQGKALEDILIDGEHGMLKSASDKFLLPCPDHHFSAQEECFTQLLRAGEIEKAHMLCQEIRDAGYQHSMILTLYLAEANKQILPNESLAYLSSYTGKNSFLLRAIVHFRYALHVSDDVAGALMHSIPRQNADEHYVYGMWLLNTSGEREEGLKELRISLAMGDTRAGKVLLEHWGNDLKTLRFLSKYHIAEANYIMGKSMIHSPGHDTQLRGWMELKIAAALGNMSAMEEIATKEYWTVVKVRQAKAKQNQNIDPKEQEHIDKSSDNAKILYQHLIQKNAASSKSISNYGELLYKDKDFINALHVLKDCSETRAQMCCGRMYEYGDGVAQDLAKAKAYYKKAANAGDKVAPKRLAAVDEKIEKNKTKKQIVSKVGYGKREEARTSTTTSSGWCFITTATCLALGKPDNCEELMAFRKFRDNYLAHTPNGKVTINEYYAIAPDIVRRIDRRKDSDSIYHNIWEDHLKDAYRCIQHGKNEKAKMLYINMVRALQRIG